MAREYTSRAIVQSGTVKADDLNVEKTAALRQINGGIGQHQVPLSALGRAKLADMRLVYPEEYSNTRSTYGAANAYHRTADNVLGVSINPGTGETTPGWIQIFTLTGGTAGTVLEFQSREGMIRGSAQIDFERRTSFVSRNDGVPTFPYTHRVDWLRFGVFLNGGLIADSGNIYPKRYTLDLPFSSPAPEGYARIELRFQSKTTRQIDASTVAGVTWAYPAPAVQYPPIVLHAGSLWARNQYR